MVYRSVIGPYFGKVLNWSVSCPMFLVRCRPHDPWMVSKQPCLSHRQGKTRIPESSEVGSNRQVDWMDKRRSNQFAVLDIQDVGNENIQEAKQQLSPSDCFSFAYKRKKRPTQKHRYLQWARQVVPGGRKPFEKRRAIT